jgi:hypothetical protein
MKTYQEFITEARHGPRNARERRQQRGENLSKILKRRLGTRASIKGGTKEYEKTTGDPDDMSTEVKVYKNPAHYAASSSPKVELDKGTKVTRSNAERAFKAKQLLRQVTRSRRNPKGQVAVIDIKPNLERDYGDTENIKQRTKNLKKAAETAPEVIRKAGVKSGDTIVAKPGQTQEGGPEKAGARSRARLYSKMHPGLSPVSKVTGRMVGKMK